MAKFKIHGTGKNTGRKRKRIYTAVTADEAKQLAENDETIIEKIIELPPEPPSDSQLGYAYDLGIEIPDNASKDDLSNLISYKIDKDRPFSERHKSFAELYGVSIPKYIGKKALFSRIQSKLIQPGREIELISWFIFRVYRGLVNGVDNAPIDRPDDPIINEIAVELKTDNRIIKSIRRYSGIDLIWFGEWTAPDGYTYNGGSNRTIAYKSASKMLRKRTLIQKKGRKAVQPTKWNRNKDHKIKKEVSAIHSFIVVGILLYFIWKCEGG